MNQKYVPTRAKFFERMLPTRFVFAILGSIGMGIIYGLKVNLSVAMVAMINHTAIIGEEVKNMYKRAEMEDGPFLWSEPLQGMLLSCYYWGYMVAQIPGALLSQSFSAKWVFFSSVFINVVCTLLTPFGANQHYVILIVFRICEGLAGGATFPAMHTLLSKWAPPAERSTISSIVYSGTSLGTVIFMFFSGILAASYGWESVFYVQGGITSLWCLVWALFIADNPAQQKIISEEERSMIINSLAGQETAHGEEKPPFPYVDVITSAPFIAIFVAHICHNTGFYLLLIELPFYMKQILHFDLKENAVVTALPFLTMWMFSLAFGRVIDVLRRKQKISTTNARKIATLISSAGPMACLIALCFVDENRSLAVALMTIAVTCKGSVFSGVLTNHIDISPNYAGLLVAITNTAATIPGILVPIFIGYITEGNQTIDAWRVIFLITIALYLVEIIIYSIFGSGEVQPWNTGTQRHRRLEE